jgi:uncharacterized protein DUF2798
MPHDARMEASTRPDPDDAGTRRAQRLLPGFLAVCMSAFVAAVVTSINTGIDGGFAARWLYAWLIALPAAILAAYLFRPLAWRAAVLVARFWR